MGKDGNRDGKNCYIVKRKMFFYKIFKRFPKKSVASENGNKNGKNRRFSKMNKIQHEIQEYSREDDCGDCEGFKKGEF